MARGDGDELVVRRRARSPRTACGRRGRAATTARRASCRSPAAGRFGPRSGRARTASSGGSPPMYMTKLLGQSSAAHISSARHFTRRRRPDRPGTEPARRRAARDPTRPGSTRNPSPGHAVGSAHEARRERMPVRMHDDGRAPPRHRWRPRPTAAAGASTSTSPRRLRQSSSSPSRNTSAAGTRVDRAWRRQRRRQSQRDLGRAVDVRGEQPRGDATVPAVGWSAEPGGNHDVDDRARRGILASVVWRDRSMQRSYDRPNARGAVMSEEPAVLHWQDKEIKLPVIRGHRGRDRDRHLEAAGPTPA